MAKHSSTISVMASIAVITLFMVAWSCPAFSDGPVSSLMDLSEDGPYEVFRREKERKEHQGALIAIVQTRMDPNAPRALVFLQTRGRSHIGKGMICQESERLEKSVLKCDQEIGDVRETLTVGAIGSKYCEELRKKFEELGDENPIATPVECGDTFPNGGCVCYSIMQIEGNPLPPNSGSGTGGHN